MNNLKVNFAFKYSENPTKVKDFLKNLDNISPYLHFNTLDFFTFSDNKGNTLLHNIILHSDLESLQLLLNLISSVDKNIKSKLLDAKNLDGNTAFHLAAKFCQTNKPNTDKYNTSVTICKLLDNSGANKNIPNNLNEVISSEAPNKTNEKSEYSQKLMSNNVIPQKTLFGGISKFLANITTDVSVDYVKKKNNKDILENLPTEVSVAEHSPTISNYSTIKESEKESEKQSEGESERETEVVESSAVNNESPDLNNDSIGEAPEGDSIVGGESDSEGTDNEGTDNEVTDDEEGSKTGGESEDEDNLPSSEINSTDSSNENNQMKGGAANSERSMMSNTSSFVKSLLTQFNSMKGGGSRSTGNRTLPSLNDFNEMYGGRDYDLSREQMKESSTLHDEVVKIFMDNGKSEEDARIMKMALYKYTKDKHPELNNLDRAKKMREYAEESSIINKLDLDTSRKIFQEVSKSKQKSKEESTQEKNTSEMNTSEIETTEEKPKKAKKTTKKTSKKTTTKTKKASKK